MKRIFYLVFPLLVLLAPVCSASPSDWEYAGTDEHGLLYSIDVRHAKMKGDPGTSRLRIDRPKDAYSYVICRLTFEDLKDGTYDVTLSHGELHNMYGSLVGRYKEDVKGVFKEGSVLWKSCEIVKEAATA